MSDQDLAALCDELERHDREMTPAPWSVDEDGDVVAAAGPGPSELDGTMVQARCDLNIGGRCPADPACVSRANGIAYLRNNAARIASELRRLMRVEATVRAAEEDRECRGKSTVTGDRWDRIVASLRGDP